MRQFQQEIGVQFPKPVRKQVKNMVREIAADQMRSQVLEETQNLGSMEAEKQDKEEDIFSHEGLNMKMNSKRKSDLLGRKEKKKKRVSVNDLRSQARIGESKKREDVWVFIPNKTCQGTIVGNQEGNIAQLKL